MKPKDELLFMRQEFGLLDAAFGADQNIYGVIEFQGERFCLVILVSSRDTGKYGYCYKAMGEEMNPYYYECPLEIYQQLSPVPAIGDKHIWQRSWRAEVQKRLGIAA
jgi:hypothetical protein